MDGFLIKGLNGSGILTLLDISGKTAAAAGLHRVAVVLFGILAALSLFKALACILKIQLNRFGERNN